MGWHLVEKLLEQSGEHSTLIGKFWVTSVFILRLLLATAIADNVWGDAQDDFTCNTLSPGCENVCFNEYSPIALTRYWMLQILFTSLPSMIFIVYTAHKLDKVGQVIKARKAKMKAKKALEKAINSSDDGEKDDKDGDEEPDDKEDTDEAMVAGKLSEDAPSKLFLVYFFVVFSRTAVEIAFMVGQYYLYTFKFMMPELWQCQHWPCPNTVDCFVSRPKEKSIMICVFFATGCIMVILNIMELFHIAENLPKAWRERGDDITKHAAEGPSFHDRDYHEWAIGADYYEDEPYGYPNATGIPTIIPATDRDFRRGRRNRRYRR